jgi:hypothetical protein
VAVGISSDSALPVTSPSLRIIELLFRRTTYRNLTYTDITLFIVSVMVKDALRCQQYAVSVIDKEMSMEDLPNDTVGGGGQK